jgi:hypothetical protein
MFFLIQNQPYKDFEWKETTRKAGLLLTTKPPSDNIQGTQQVLRTIHTLQNGQRETGNEQKRKNGLEVPE